MRVGRYILKRSLGGFGYAPTFLRALSSNNHPFGACDINRAQLISSPVPEKDSPGTSALEHRQ